MNLIAYGTKGIPEPAATYSNEFSRFFIAEGKQSQSPNKLKAMEPHESNIHIGHLIREQLKADERSVSWLAREIHCTRNHVYKIFNKPSLDGDLILKISVAMNFNFFQFYTTEYFERIKTRTGEKTS